MDPKLTWLQDAAEALSMNQFCTDLQGIHLEWARTKPGVGRAARLSSVTVEAKRVVKKEQVVNQFLRPDAGHT